ncbi:MAG: single-stranded DNA-binding protein [Bacteroidales bacterium]
MAKGLNKVTLIGNLGKDPEVKETTTGKIAKFTLATNESYRSKNGDLVDHVEWHNITIWNKLADIAEKYLKKGDQVYLEGKIRRNDYEVDGEKRISYEIYVDQLLMLGGRFSENDSFQNENLDVADSI